MHREQRSVRLEEQTTKLNHAMFEGWDKSVHNSNGSSRNLTELGYNAEVIRRADAFLLENP